MAAQSFNSLGGYTAGIPPVTVVDSNGNVVTNVLTTGNVAANAFYSDNYYLANGAYLPAYAAGNNTQLQYNNNGKVGGIPNVTWDGTLLRLGNISNISISGGLNGYFLQTDGFGNLTWAAGGGGGNGSPGGSNTQVQFNQNGTFAGVSGFTYNTNNNTLAVSGTINVTNLSASNINTTGNVVGNYFSGNGAGLTGITTEYATYVTSNNQPNITGVGTLSGLSVAGNIISSQYISAANIQTGGKVQSGSLTVSGTSTFNGTIITTANVTMTNSPSVTLGPVSNIHISGGLNGYVLTTDGLGNLSWSVGGNGGGNIEPAGANTQIQYNANGVFAASPYLTYDYSSHTLNVGGNFIANTIQIGSGAYEFCTSEVYFATTASTAPNQVLFSIPTASVSAVDFQIIATDSIANTRQSAKISSLYYSGLVSYTEYAGLQINGGVGQFDVTYNPGNIIVQPAIQLTVTPDTNNSIVYKMQITVYAA
jgi:hypothetical protein